MLLSSHTTDNASSQVSGTEPKWSVKWFGGALGALIALADAFTLKWLGVNLTSHGHDVTLVVAGWFGVSFAVLGFTLGKAIEDRHRSQGATELIRAQMKELDASREQLLQSEKLAALGTLATAIAHEVRNPLAVIRSAAQSLAETVSSTTREAQRSCQFVIKETDRLANLVNSLLAFARPLRAASQPVAVSELFDRALLLARADIESRQVCLERQESTETTMAIADPNLMAQVLAGLLTNAAQAVPVGGKVRIGCHQEDSCVELAVEDSGPGVPPDLHNRIFEPFFTTRASGIGLGLAIARQIAEAHGSSITLGESSTGGARFSVMLRCASLA
jgi:signal transduction histidine kinase